MELISKIKTNNWLLFSSAILLPGGFVFLAYLLFDKGKRAVREARKYIGEEEIAGNLGFQNPEFQAIMEEYSNYGFHTGEQWCMHFASMIWQRKYKSEKYKYILEQLLTPSTQTTFNNFKNDTSGLFHVSQKAKVGSIVIWQKVENGIQSGWAGHAGIVLKETKEGFKTIEGNVNNAENYKGEGIVAQKEYDYTIEFNRKNGLKLLGFIEII